jgi:hypothetical protein
MDDGFSFDLSAAEWRRNLTDEKAYVHALATRLAQALPDKAQVDYDRHLFSKEETVRLIEVHFENTTYRLHFDKRSGIATEKAKVVHGIALKTEGMPFTDWLDALSADLSTYADQHTHAREALERFLFS